MNDYKSIPNPPITEALIDIRVRPLDGSTIARLRQTQPEDYPICQPQMEFTGEFSIQSPTEATATTTQQELGWVFRSSEHSYVMQARINGFTMSRLKPYEDWAPFVAEAKRGWQRFREAGQSIEVTRLAVRYINRIELPKDDARLSKYFRTHPVLSKKLMHQDLEGFVMTLQVPQPDLSAKLRLRQGVTASPKGSNDVISVVLDIDLFRRDAVPQTDEEIWEYFDQLRHRKNEVFFQSITARTDKMLRKLAREGK
jgi:uncharacterized protein (TIGR04255 family)